MEGGCTYDCLLESFLEGAKHVTGEDWTDRIKQVHGDYHLGLESSRQRVVPASRRCSDFRHLVAATKRKQLAGPGEEIERVNVWRQGIMAVLKSKCQSEDCLPVLERAVYISRILCHGAFSTLWQTVLDWLRLCGEGAAAGTLEKYYLEVQDGQWDASWRCSVDVALPGFGTGSQSQEAWHRHRLKSSLGSSKDNNLVKFMDKNGQEDIFRDLTDVYVCVAFQ